MSGQPVYDIAIAGGGINGCGIARDAAGRGFSVLLVEQGDLAGGTSSRSTKLVHGGLRYLERFEFRLVHEALAEREVLWRLAPHIIHPMRFVLPHHRGLRPAWMLRLGLFLYDHIGGRRKLPPTRVLDLRSHEAGMALRPEYRKGFEYSDLWVDDSRLVVLNARDAADRGASIRTRSRLAIAERVDDAWRLVLQDTQTGAREEARARLLVNATGPWSDAFLANTLGNAGAGNLRLVQGSHIVVPKLFAHDRCYIFQNADGRIIFAIPYEGDFTLIGTTDRDYEGDPAAVTASGEEIAYLCAGASAYFRKPVRPEDVVWTYAGVRALHDDRSGRAQDTTRDYLLDREGDEGEAALINIFGGKITTYRRLAEEALALAEEALGRRGEAWTGNVALPGGDIGGGGMAGLSARLREAFPFLTPALIARLARAYGTEAFNIIGEARTSDDLGEDFGGGLSAREVAYLMAREWARTAEDVLWRRGKLGLGFSPDGVARLEAWMKRRQPAERQSPNAAAMPSISSK